MKIQFHIGIDISKNHLDYCVLDSKKLAYQCRIKNSKKDIHKSFKDLRKLGVTSENTWFCAEFTGVYGNTIRECLEEQAMKYSMIPAIEISKSIGLVRGKNDVVDAHRIAEYCMRYFDKLNPSKIPAKYLLKLKQLFTFRQHQIRVRTGLLNHTKSIEKSWDSAPKKMILRSLKKQIINITKVIKTVENEMMQIIKNEPQADKNFNLLISVPGIGSLTACYMIICTENFELFNDARKFASYCGVAPFEHSSGTSIKGKTKTSKYRNKTMKTLFHNGVTSAIYAKNELSTYYKRRINEGKNKNVVKNAIIFKMVGRAFAVIKRQSPYIQLDLHKNAA